MNPKMHVVIVSRVVTLRGAWSRAPAGLCARIVKAYRSKGLVLFEAKRWRVFNFVPETNRDGSIFWTAELHEPQVDTGAGT